MDIVNWVIANWTLILDIVAYTIAIATIIVRLTPTTTDNVVLDRIVWVLEKLSLYKRPSETTTTQN